MDQTPYQPPASAPSPESSAIPTADERNLGMLCHLLGIITGYTLGLGFLGPLVLWLMKKDTSPFVDHHGKEALNFQLTVMLAIFCLGAVTFVLMFFVIGVLLIPVLVVVGIIALVIEILACIAAHRGEWYRYPFSIRFIN
jgi:uncharacterized protein